MANSKPMDIETMVGNEVRYAFPQNGYPFDQELASQHLKLGQVYFLTGIKVRSFSTIIQLEGFPGVWFNSCLFENV